MAASDLNTSLMVLAVLEGLQTTVADRAAHAARIATLVATRDRFLARIAPELAECGWTLGTIGKVTETASVATKTLLGHGLADLVCLVPSKCRNEEGTPALGFCLAVRRDNGSAEDYEERIKRIGDVWYEGFTGFKKAMRSPKTTNERRTVAKGKALGMTVFCFGRVITSTTETYVGVRLLAPEDVYTPAEAALCETIDHDAPRPALVRAASNAVPKKPGRRPAIQKHETETTKRKGGAHEAESTRPHKKQKK